MTAPRQVVPGRTHLMTRRCTQRQFLLRPDALVEQTYLYCLGEAAQRFNITLHGWIAMSNHQHVIVRDNEGNFPAFLAHVNKMTAKALNVYWGRWENFWAAEQPNAVHLVDAQDRFDKLIYLLANPVADHLVERVADWPGASSLRLNISGGAITVKRPRGFFREDGPMPAEVTLRAERPAGFEHLADDEWRGLLLSDLHKAEERARAVRRETNTRVVGRKNVLAAAHTDQPTTMERRRRLRPCVACRDVDKRKRELAALRNFREAYRRARERWCQGEHRVVFPFGTYRLRDMNVRCAPPDELFSGAA